MTYLGQLAELALLEGQGHAAQTPQHRAAGMLWAALITAKSAGAARSVLEEFASPDVAADAIGLLDRLAAADRRQRKLQWGEKGKRMAAAAQLRAEGKSLREIAGELGIAPSTVLEDLRKWELATERTAP